MKALEINHHFTVLMHACMPSLLLLNKTNTNEQANMIYMRPNTIYISKKL